MANIQGQTQIHCEVVCTLRFTSSSRVEDAVVLGSKDVHAVDVTAMRGNAVGELGDDPHRVRTAEDVDPVD